MQSNHVKNPSQQYIQCVFFLYVLYGLASMAEDDLPLTRLSNSSRPPPHL